MTGSLALVMAVIIRLKNCQEVLQSLQLTYNFLLHFNMSLILNTMKLFVHITSMCCFKIDCNPEDGPACAETCCSIKQNVI
jgi:hypothetical protein